MTSIKLYTLQGRFLLVILALLVFGTGSAMAQRGATGRRTSTQNVDSKSNRVKKVVKKSGTRARQSKSTGTKVRSTAETTGRGTARKTSRGSSRLETKQKISRGSARRDTARPSSRGGTGRATAVKTTRSETVVSRGTRSDRRQVSKPRASRAKSAGNDRAISRAKKKTVYVAPKRSRYSNYRSNRQHHRHNYYPSSKRHYGYQHYSNRYWYASPRIFWPNIHVHFSWPWQLRYSRYWAPRYRYRQIVVIKTDWNRSSSVSRVELETFYSHRVIFADDNSAELEIRIESIDTYIEGQFFGSISSIPEELSTVHARVLADGRVEFDRELFVLGDSRSGFELISTRYYDGNVVNEYRESDGYLAARLDFERGEARRIGRSRLFKPHDARAFIPVSLLPEDQRWLWDSGPESVSAYNDNYDYYYGSGGQQNSVSQQNATFPPNSVSGEYQNEYTAHSGADISFSRKTELQRVE